MDFVKALTKVIPVNSVNPKGFIYVQGRMAYLQKKSIFDCPFDLTDDKSDVWLDGFMFEEKKSA